MNKKSSLVIIWLNPKPIIIPICIYLWLFLAPKKHLILADFILKYSLFWLQIARKITKGCLADFFGFQDKKKTLWCRQVWRIFSFFGEIF
jgi:hypothetical protein